MRPASRLLAAALLALLTGCRQAPRLEESGEINTWLVKTVQDAAMKNAIVAQHTLYPYHFVDDAEGLNELGKADFHVLADHYLLHPGPLNVRRGGAPMALYEARVRKVRDLLGEAGVSAERVAIADGLPGGEGLSSERVLRILEEEDQGQERPAAPRRGAGASARSGTRGGRTGTGTGTGTGTQDSAGARS
ncbi:MAG: hypothetical protein HY721_10990 [Planctomycetes bacterium]|nr:hypothetical protein [Planctomycetota bacterium]